MNDLFTVPPPCDAIRRQPHQHGPGPCCRCRAERTYTARKGWYCPACRKVQSAMRYARQKQRRQAGVTA